MIAARLVAAIALVVALVAAVQPALAERVFVRAASGQLGHAWLFGSQRQDADTCWLAVPRHVVVDEFTGKVAPFTFETMTGGGGQSGMPIPVSTYPDALAAMEGIDDMAFAPVVVGPRPGECLSRLGPPPFAYPSLIRSATELTLFSLLPGSYGIFRVDIAKGRADAAGGGMLKLRPVNASDARAYLVKGLSGAVAEAQQSEGMVPVAMVTELSGTPPVADAIRFDLIRAAFEIVEAHELAVTPAGQASGTGVPYKIVNVEGITASGKSGPAALAGGNACWTVAPPGGQRAVRLTITLAAGTTRGLSVVQADGCGNAGGRVVIEQRPDASIGWSTATDCSTVATSGEAPACRLDLRAPRDIRISILADGPIGLTQLRLY